MRRQMHKHLHILKGCGMVTIQPSIDPHRLSLHRDARLAARAA